MCQWKNIFNPFSLFNINIHGGMTVTVPVTWHGYGGSAMLNTS